MPTTPNRASGLFAELFGPTGPDCVRCGGVSLHQWSTPKGRKVVERALGPLLGQLAEIADALGDEQRQVLNSFFAEVSERILQQAKAARPRPTRRAVARTTVNR